MNEDKRKHLEFIQNNVSRMNSSSFKIKGWMVTVVTALLGLFASSFNSQTMKGYNVFIYIGIVPTIFFWFLDSYYLQQERKFRGIYNDIIGVTKNSEIKEYEMPVHNYIGFKYSLLNAMFSKSEWPVYLITILGLLIAGILL